MSETAEAILLAVCLLATSIWIGGYVAIAIVARTASVVMEQADRVRFFGSLGRTYLRVGLPALIVALASGGVLARDVARETPLIATVVVVVALLVSLAIAVVQARRMTVLRRRLLASPGDEQLREQVRRGARAAGVLRGLLGVFSVVIVVLAAFLAT